MLNKLSIRIIVIIIYLFNIILNYYFNIIINNIIIILFKKYSRVIN